MRNKIYKEDHQKSVKKNNEKRYKIRREWMNRQKCSPCKDCHIQYSPWVMHFDHRNPEEKKFNVSQMIKRPLDLIQKEINKCDVVCANCHAERTHKQLLKEK